MTQGGKRTPIPEADRTAIVAMYAAGKRPKAIAAALPHLSYYGINTVLYKARQTGEVGRVHLSPYHTPEGRAMIAEITEMRARNYTWVMIARYFEKPESTIRDWERVHRHLFVAAMAR